jgi:hypothetical protein
MTLQQLHAAVIARAIEQTKIANRQWEADNAPLVAARAAATAARLARANANTDAHLVPRSLPSVSANHHVVALIIDNRLLLIDDSVLGTSPVVLAVQLVIEKAKQSKGAIELQEPVDANSYVKLVRSQAWNPSGAQMTSGTPPPARITLHEEGESVRSITAVGPVAWAV